MEKSIVSIFSLSLYAVLGVMGWMLLYEAFLFAISMTVLGTVLLVGFNYVIWFI
jgi:hypothetical protein